MVSAALSIMFRGEKGYIDQSFSILMMAVIGIVIAGPYLIQASGADVDNDFKAIGRLVIAGLVIAGLQAASIIFSVYEVYWDAYRSGNRLIVNRFCMAGCAH